MCINPSTKCTEDETLLSEKTNDRNIRIFVLKMHPRGLRFPYLRFSCETLL
jgi:hypothetical protein